MWFGYTARGHGARLHFCPPPSHADSVMASAVVTLGSTPLARSPNARAIAHSLLQKVEQVPGDAQRVLGLSTVQRGDIECCMEVLEGLGIANVIAARRTGRVH